MLSSLTLLVALLPSGSPGVESVFQPLAVKAVEGKPAHTTAIVLIHGYHVHLFDRNVPKASFRSWQRPDAALVTALRKHADVYAFAYGQDACIDTIVTKSRLAAEIAELRKRDYCEIVLVGHSAGGLIARHFVEDHPDCGVTRVVQVSPPNGGSPLATLRVPKAQRVFVDCLSLDARKTCMKERCDKKIPEHVEFVCIMSKTDLKATTDGVVPCVHQWTPDLQKQGIPTVPIAAGHLEVVRDTNITARLAELIRTPHPRWTKEQVETARQRLFGP